MIKRITALILCALLTAMSVNAADINFTADTSAGISEVSAEEALTPPEGTPSGIDNAELKTAVALAKELFGDTSDYNSFDSYVDTNGSASTYSLFWSDSEKRGDMRISVGDDGEIYSYYLQDASFDNDGKIVLPEKTKQQALESALSFVGRVSPDIAGFFGADKADVEYGGGYYRVNLYAQSAGYLAAFNTLTLYVSSDGIVTRYTRNTSNAVEPSDSAKPAVDDVIISAFKKTSPMELAYVTDYPDTDGKKASVKLVYRLGENYMNSIIDAESGSAYILDYSKSYDITDDYGGYYSNNGVNTEESAASDSAFSEAEIENIAMNEDFITAEYALDILKSMSELDIEQNAKLTSSSLRASKSIYTGKTTYYWKLNIENGDKSSYASVKADDGFVKSYICYNYAEPVLYSSLQNSDDSCRASADAYIAKYYPDAAGEYVIDEEYAAPRYSDNDMISEFSYYYVRTVNGVRFDNDHITVVINPDDMTIERTYYERSDASFPSVKGSIGADAAQDAYWAAAPLNAMYTLYTDIDGDTVNAVYCDTSYTPKKLLLICKYGDYLYVDAKNGNVLTTSFDEYVYTANEYYTESSFGDISGSKYEKQITLLYNMDIIDGTENFSPEKTITISEFYAMLNACGLYFNTDSGKLCFDGSKDGRLLSREDALSCMVDALGYHDVASLEGIYKSPFTDGDKLSGAALGHTSIAYALGLADIFGDTLSPQTRLTRGEAAGLIYTYITGNF